MAESSGSSSGGVGVAGLLGVTFVVLKLTGVITWSWWWVTAPFWGSAAVFVAILPVVYGYFVIKRRREQVRYRELMNKPSRMR